MFQPCSLMLRRMYMKCWSQSRLFACQYRTKASDRLVRLSASAAVSVQNSIDEVDTWPCDLSGSNQPVEHFEFVPDGLRKQVTQQFAEGWANLLRMIHILLVANLPPTATLLKRQGTQDLGSNSNHANQFPDTVLNFLTHGGRVEYALDALLDHLYKTNEVTGDYSDWEWTHGGGEKQMAKEEALPECDNDWDIKLLGLQLYDDDLVPDGPYYRLGCQSSAKDSDECSNSLSQEDSEDDSSCSDEDMFDGEEDSSQGEEEDSDAD